MNGGVIEKIPKKKLGENFEKEGGTVHRRGMGKIQNKGRFYSKKCIFNGGGKCKIRKKKGPHFSWDGIGKIPKDIEFLTGVIEKI